MQFNGYKRPDGKVGIRNKILILPTCSCSSETAAQIARNVEGAIAIVNQNGCAQTDEDLQITRDVLIGFAANPNVYSTVVIGNGCESIIPSVLVEQIKAVTSKPIDYVTVQEDGGTIGAADKGTRIARKMAEEASQIKSEPVDMSELILATECGGSDSTSGLTANPVVGACSDLMVKNGATVILSETTEFIGAEHILARRAKNEEVKSRIYEIIERYENHLRNVGGNLRDGNPTPGNKAGGLSTIEEKSLGCIHKGGHTVINEVLDYGVVPSSKGLVIMDTPGYDVASLTGMAAGGAQIAVFTTGRGTPMGNPIMPVIKLTGNKGTYGKMTCNIDMDVSQILNGSKSVEQCGKELFEEVLRVADGKKVKAELLGINDIGISRLCNYV